MQWTRPLYGLASMGDEPVVHVGHTKAHDHPYRHHAKPKRHPPHLYRERRADRHHVDAEPYRWQCPTMCLSCHGTYCHRDGMRHAIIELEALRDRALTSEDVDLHD